MKKILLAVTAALAITSCSQNEEFDNAGQNAEISFGTIVRNSTRADILATDNIKTFTVSGYKTEGEMVSTTQLAGGFIDNLKVDKKDPDGWGYTGTFYWPYSGKVQFFATSPAQTLNVADAVGYPTFEYAVKDVATQEDLVAANLIDKDRTSGTLILPFQHLLTQVNFSIKGDTPGFTYTVTKIVLTGMMDKATFKFDGTSTVGAWQGAATATSPDLKYEYTGSFIVTPQEADKEVQTNLEATGKALFMLMPQDASAVKLTISYSAVNGEQKGFSGEKDVTLTGTWTMGHSIRYILKLTSDTTPVTFGQPTSGEWIPENPQSDEIPTPAK
ncbi:fimbrillin family protein [Bacteroides ovatus]|uniref:fimbrillin family protein n=1 Tax=Bacteroides ovatus TaxID=28116 RepID=UPI003144D8F4